MSNGRPTTRSAGPGPPTARMSADGRSAPFLTKPGRRGTERSNPSPSSGESANFRFLASNDRRLVAGRYSAPHHTDDDVPERLNFRRHSGSGVHIREYERLFRPGSPGSS